MTDPDADNPYASPATDVMLASRFPEAATEAERLRRKYLRHEATIQSLGTLQYFGAGVLAFAGLGALLIPGVREKGHGVILAAGFIIAAVGICFVARGLQRLEPWARIAAIVLLALNILAALLAQRAVNAVALGFVIVILYWLLNAKGRMVFSAEYRQAVAATPHIKYRTARWVWIALAVIMGLVALGIVLGSVRN